MSLDSQLPATWLDPWTCLSAAIARERAIAAGVSWVVTPEERARRAALLVRTPDTESITADP